MASVNVQTHSRNAISCKSHRIPGSSRRCVVVKAEVLKEGSTILVAGSTGGVGQLVTAKLLERGYKVRALTRSVEKARQLFGSTSMDLEVVAADCRDPSSLPDLLQGVDAVCSSTGTTAFPSTRWEGNNGPRPTDLVATGNLISACPPSLKRFLLVTSAGVERQKVFPYTILNTFGVLHFKRQSELALMSSGLPYTILRPGRLTDGPYTSFDLNTLLQATAGTRQQVSLAPRDELQGETSRIAVAEALVQSLTLPETINRTFSLTSVDGEGPGTDAAAWSALFKECY